MVSLNTNTFYKTFTGADALAFAIFPDTKPILLGSLTTLSYSIYREKKPVPLLGKINTGGFTRGMRTIAGTMVFTLINQHFAKDVVEQVPYLEAHGKVKSDELPFFDIMVVCANEYGTSSQMMIYGAEFVDDQQVISISDMYIENVFGFVARDIDTFDNKNYLSGQGNSSSSGGGGGGGSIDTVMPYALNINSYKEFMDSTMLSSKNINVYKAQVKLNEFNIPTNMNGVYDNDTVQSIGRFQKLKGVRETGILDDVTYSLLTSEEDSNNSLVRIINKNGVFVYSNTNKDNVIGISKYGDSYLGKKIDELIKIKFNDSDGYIEVNDTNLKNKTKFDFYDYIKANTIHKIKINDFIPSDIGTNIFSTSDIDIKITAISHYKNSIKNLSKYITVKKGIETDLTLSLIPSSFIYDIEEESCPTYVEFIIYTNECEPKKWMVELK